MSSVDRVELVSDLEFVLALIKELIPKKKKFRGKLNPTFLADGLETLSGVCLLKTWMCKFQIWKLQKH